MLASTEAEYHKKAVERFGEFFENAHDPENFQMHMYTGADVQRDLQRRRGRRGVAQG